MTDSGAEVSLMHWTVYDSLKVRPKLQIRKILLQSVNGKQLKVDGCAVAAFEVGGVKTTHLFYVVGNMNQKLIL